MAKIEFCAPVASVSGKMNKKDNVYFRVMNGKRYGVLLLHPRTREKASEKEKTLRTKMGKLSREASRIHKDEALAAAYNDWMKRGYTSRYRCILGELLKGEGA